METEEKTLENLNNFWQQQFEESSANEVFLEHSRNSNFFEAEKSFAETNGDKWLKIIKGLFLYLPGAFLLFMTSTFLFEAYFSMNWDFVQILSGVPWLVLYGFMVMFGIGEFKHQKSLAIPFSIVGISIIAFLISQLFSGSPNSIFYSTAYLLPLVFAVPFFVKNLIKEETQAE